MWLTKFFSVAFLHVTGFVLRVLHTSCKLFSAPLTVGVLCQFRAFEQNISSAQDLFLFSPTSTPLPYSADSCLSLTSDTPSFRMPFELKFLESFFSLCSIAPYGSCFITVTLHCKHVLTKHM